MPYFRLDQKEWSSHTHSDFLCFCFCFVLPLAQAGLVLLMKLRLTLNSCSSCLHLQWAWVIGMNHYTRLNFWCLKCKISCWMKPFMYKSSPIISNLWPLLMTFTELSWFMRLHILHTFLVKYTKKGLTFLSSQHLIIYLWFIRIFIFDCI